MIETMELEIKLKTKSPFRIGTQKSFSGIDQPIVKLGEKIKIPGTSLKGALRHEIEAYLLDSFPENPEMKPCIPASRLSSDEKKLVNNKKYRRSSCHYPCKIEKYNNNKKCISIKDGNSYGLENEKNKRKHSICPACYFLGAQGLPGFLIVPFLDTTGKEDEFASVRIDRGKGTVASEGPRQYTVLPEGTTFTGTMTLLLKDTIKDWEFGKPRTLSEATLGDLWLKNYDKNNRSLIKEFVKDRLENITILGGLKSVGAGKVKIETSFNI